MPTNVNINVTARRNTGESDQSYVSTEQDSTSQPYESSSNTSPLDPEESAYRRKSLPLSRSAPANHSRSRSRPQSRVDDYFEEEDFELPLGPSISIPGPAPEPPTARSQRASAPASREASEEREPVRERREKHKRHHHKKHHHHRRRARSPSETTTEEMAERGFVNEFGQWVADRERPQQYPAPHDYIAAQQYQQAQSTHPGGALVPTNQYNPQNAMYHHHQGYPPQTPFYPQPMSPNPGLGMMMPPFFPYNMMGGMQAPSSPPAESDELRRLKEEMAAQRAKEQRAYDDYARAQQRKQDEKIEREELEKAKKDAVKKALDEYRLAEAEKAEQAKKVAKAIDDAKKESDDKAEKKAKEVEAEHKKKLDEAEKKMEEAKKASEAAKKELKEAKGPPDNDKKVSIEICAVNMKSKKFNIPWPHSKSWKTLQPLLLDAYARSDDKNGPMLAARMEEGHFDVTDSTGGAIMVQYWDMIIKPDTDVKVTVRPPEAPAPKHHVVDVPGHKHKGEHGVHRSKSSKSKKRQSKVMFGELPSDIPGPAPPPPLATYGGPMEAPTMEYDDDIVEVVDDSSTNSGPVMVKKKKKKQPGMMDILFRGGKSKK